MEIRPATAEEVQNAQAAGASPLVRLALSMECCISQEEMHTNFYATLDRGFTPINDHIGKDSGTCSLVGAAPSIKQTYKDLKGDVVAINSAIGFLLDNGVVPKYAMLWDGADIVEEFARPHPEVTYLIASRCHAKVFERLKDCKVVVWHAGGDHDIFDVMQKQEVIQKIGISQPLVLGGSAGITRGIFLVAALGYSDVHLFGADSSYSSEGKTHVNGSLVKEKDMVVSLGNGPAGSPAQSVVFRTTPELCAQVNEYRSIYAMSVNAASGIRKGLYPPSMIAPKFSVHGAGLLKAMHERLEAKLATDGEDKFLADIAKEDEQQRMMDTTITAATTGNTPERKDDAEHVSY